MIFIIFTYCVTQLKLYTLYKQTWNLSKKLHRRIFSLKILHCRFHLISTVWVRKNTKNEWKWRNLHRWEKFYTAAGSDGSDKFHLCIIIISSTCCLQQTRRGVGGRGFGAKRRKTSVPQSLAITAKTIAIIVVTFTNMLFECIVHLCRIKRIMLCILHWWFKDKDAVWATSWSNRFLRKVLTTGCKKTILVPFFYSN